MKKMILSLFVLLLSTQAFADKIVLLDNNKDSLQARVDYIRGAQETIRAQYFTIDNDRVSNVALALLMESAARNPKLKVQILVDSMHNLMLRQTMAAVMGNNSSAPSNIEIREYNKFNLFKLFRYTKRMHDKGLIIDGKSMISGGRNIANGYYGASGDKKGTKTLPVFEDSDALLLDSPAINVATRYFDDLWNDKRFVSKAELYDYSRDSLSEDFCRYRNRGEGDDSMQCEASRQSRLKIVQAEQAKLARLTRAFNGNELNITTNAKNWAAEAIEVTNVDFLFDDVKSQKSNLDKPEKNIGSQLYAAIAKASSSVIIVTPYLVITPEQEALFKGLREKNVEVTLFTNSKGSNDVPAAYVGYENTRDKAMNLGVKVYEYQGPDTLHAKMVLIDRSILFIGSFNWDFRSQNLNREVGILAHLPEDRDNDLQTDVIRKFAKILKKSCRVGGQICNPTYRSENLAGLSDEEFNDLMEAFQMRKEKSNTLYKIMYPLLEKQL
jgi:putative cardiolipin synthase